MMINNNNEYVHKFVLGEVDVPLFSEEITAKRFGIVVDFIVNNINMGM